VDGQCCFCFGVRCRLIVRIHRCVVLSASSVMDLKKYKEDSATIPVLLSSDSNDIKW
jgi:hypothetical protein